MPDINPYTVHVTDSTLAAIKQRVQNYPWHEMPDDGGWDYGTNLNYLREFCNYWVNDYDWRKHEEQTNDWPESLQDTW